MDSEQLESQLKGSGHRFFEIGGKVLFPIYNEAATTCRAAYAAWIVEPGGEGERWTASSLVFTLGDLAHMTPDGVLARIEAADDPVKFRDFDPDGGLMPLPKFAD